MTGSNRRPPACKAGALPAELILLGIYSEAMSYSHRGKPPTTIGSRELNFRVRYGNGCDLSDIITSLFTWTRIIIPYLDCFSSPFFKKDDPYGIRTRVTAVKGRCLNHLTNGPWRRRRDLNPRAGYPTYTLSRGASSAS